MGKKIVAFALIMTLSLTFLESCGSENSHSKGDPLILTMAELNPVDTIVGKMDVKFKEAVYELSGGSIVIDLHTDSVLGDEAQTIQNMLSDNPTIDLYRASASSLAPYGTEDWGLLTIPYNFSDKEHIWNFVNSDLGVEVLLEPHNKGIGVRGLFFGEEGFRSFFTVDEVNCVEDLQGKAIRVSDDPVMRGMVEGLGATPVVISFPDLYASLRTGKADGAEQPVANYKSNYFYDVAPNLILDKHTLGITAVIITDSCWDSLTTEQQSILIDAGKIASDYCRQISDQAENEVIRDLKVLGVNVVDVTDVTPWQEACKDIISKESATNPELYSQILAFDE